MRRRIIAAIITALALLGAGAAAATSAHASTGTWYHASGAVPDTWYHA